MGQKPKVCPEGRGGACQTPPEVDQKLDQPEYRRQSLSLQAPPAVASLR